jgi:hypothetical protein
LGVEASGRAFAGIASIARVLDQGDVALVQIASIARHLRKSPALLEFSTNIGPNREHCSVFAQIASIARVLD